MDRILIIGGGCGIALAHDLSLRGFAVTLVERGELTCGTTGRHHGLLHSGTRYAMNDADTAAECYAENQILRRIAPQAIEPNDGLFVALGGDTVHQHSSGLQGQPYPLHGTDELVGAQDTIRKALQQIRQGAGGHRSG